MHLKGRRRGQYAWHLNRFVANRRSVLKAGAGAFVGTSLSSIGKRVLAAESDTIDQVPQNITRTWIGPPFWANRLQDWRLNNGQIECTPDDSAYVGRTVSVLTHELASGLSEARISVRTGMLQQGSGFSGILLGAGGGVIDYRAAALVQAACGINGGILCTFDRDGRIYFRNHAAETGLFAGILSSTTVAGPAPGRQTTEDVILEVVISPTPAPQFTLTVSVYDTASGTLLAQAYRRVTDDQIIGGIALMSSAASGNSTRFWFRDLRISGSKVVVRSSRAEGPIFATQFSLNGSILKLSAQLFPIATTDPQMVTLQVRPSGGSWQTAATTSVQSGYVAHFRVTGWNSNTDYDYRVGYAIGTSNEQFYSGVISREPNGNFPIGMVSCHIHSFRPLDRGSSSDPQIPGEQAIPLYTPGNMYFPYQELVDGMTARGCKMLLALGDQFYETKPTLRPTATSPTLDFLYRYYLWLWSFREMTRIMPTITLVDDHDVYQGNIWGNGGAPAGSIDATVGYARDASWVNIVQSVQCGHNPDAYDPTPVKQGITVYYCAFRYGRVSFAVLEDRKWKTLRSAASPQLLGARQEAFLADWATMHPGLPKICLTQTVLTSVTTDEDGDLHADSDTSGAPAAAHRRAVQLLKQAKALVLAGDQHLATLVRHGINGYVDGPLQFSGPAAGTAYPRWFEPAGSSTNTGNFIDGFGNKMRVLAVANPTVSQATFLQYYPSVSYGIADRNLKADGYGVVDVRSSENAFVIECWPWNKGTGTTNPQQYAGWPYRIAFTNL